MSVDETKETVIIPPAPPEPGDSRLDSFLQKAAPIIAVERGINGKSRVKLESIARDMHLPDDLFEQGIHMLQGAPPVDDKRENRWTSAFRQYVHAKLENLPRRILTFRMEARVVAVATSKFQLHEDEAREIIRIVARESEVRRVSQSEAEKYVVHLVHSKVGDSAWLDDKTMSRLHAVGTEWGLSSEQVDAIIRQFTYDNRRKQERERRNTVITLTLAGAVVVVLICGLVYAVLRNKASDPEEQVAASNPGTQAKKPSVEPPIVQRVEAPEWWNSDVTIAVSKSRVNTPGFGEIYPLLASDDPAVRSEGYTQLVALANATTDLINAFPRLRSIIVNCYAIEPADQCADVLRSELLDREAASEEELPEDENHYGIVLRNGEVALKMLQHEDVPDRRAQSLEEALHDLLKMSVSRSEQPDLLQRKMTRSLLERFYRQLTIAGPSNAVAAQGFYKELSQLGRRYLDPRDINRLEAEFMSAIVPPAGAQWRDYVRLIDDCIVARDTNSVLKVLEVLTKSENKELQQYISGRLVDHLRLKPVSLSPEDVVAAVRDELGIVVPVAPKSSRQRWQQLQEMVDQALAPAAPAATQTTETLQKTVELSYLATLALALAQQDPGFPIFDQLFEEGTPDITGAKARIDGDRDPSRHEIRGRPRATLGVVATKRQRLGEHLARLRLPGRVPPATRLYLLREIAQITDYLEDISTEQANILVFYALWNKEEDEFDKAYPYLIRLAKWNRFVLAMADTLAEKSIDPNARNQKLFSGILESDVRIGEDIVGWPQQLQRKMMEKVVSQSVKRLPAADDPNTHVENATEEIRDLYVARARLLGVPPAEYAAVSSPSAAMNLLVSHSARRASGNGSAASARLVAELPHRSSVIDYLADNDMRRTVMLQRLWLELVALDVARMQPTHAGKVDSLVQDLQARDRQSTDILSQLYDGEKSILQAWMFLAP